ncbi:MULTISPECIES: hypothetical protein [Bacillus]|uniref:Uncharacterized protein n=1 Tax=Bacillus paranthracis TaxID=2026186 RepID=A0A7D8D281_9BACI|nr:MULTISPECIES: hypothetical protein [Bacillus]ANT40247.1 hypothetical protein [Bacillus phage PfNC7401]ANT40316.1 hypothetical protein [Bacillus phage PfIS075]EJP82581.1 hypothetical protein IAU_05797 [Bacillus cereus IS075]EOO82201.1 hypothetical protein IGS_05964 [Bacillus cereus IS845/00]EOO95321.1 hypothetical protein IGQ_04080 [Bacillus cereus IS195]
MSQVFQFNFEKTYKEVDVAGKVYQVEFNDDAINKYQKSLKSFGKKTKEVQGLIPDYEKATDEEIDNLMNKQKELVKHVVETFLGEGTFEDLYEKAGKSVGNLMTLVDYLNNLYLEEAKEKAEKVQAKYLANVKK